MTASIFGQRLKAARGAVGITQAEAARRVGVSSTGWASWEQWRSSPTVEMLPAIAAAVGTTAASLLGGDSPAPDDLTLAVASLDASEREAVAGVIEALRRGHGSAPA